MARFVRRRSLSAAELRGLAHPLRVRLLEQLREGAGTATTLAQALGESSGATSYHLRALARAGLVVEDDRLSRGRERWWRKAEPMTVVYPSGDDAESVAALSRLRAVVLDRDDRALAEYVRDPPRGAWRDAGIVGNWTVHATPAEIAELTTRVLELVDELRRRPEERLADADAVVVTWRALPRPRADA